jgi:hypothetical protein
MKKKSTRGYFALVALAILLFKPSAAIHAQTIFFQDNFETGTIDPAKWLQNPTNVPNPNSSVAQDSSNFSGSSGTWSAQQLYHAGWTDGGGVGWMNLGKAQLPSHVLIEFDFKLSPNFHFPLGHKWWRSMPDMNAGQGSNDTIVNNQLDNYGIQLNMAIFSNSTTYGYKEYTLRPSLAAPVTANVWHRVGYRYKKNTFTGSTPNLDGQIEIFYDGVSLGSLNNVRLTADPTRWLRDYWGGPGNYTSVVDNNPIPQDQWIRIDNFKITDLGSGSVPTSPSLTAPIAPTSLAVQ